MDGPGILRPGRWIGVPELSLQHLTTWVVEAAQVLDGCLVVAAQLRVGAGRCVADVEAAKV